MPISQDGRAAKSYRTDQWMGSASYAELHRRDANNSPKNFCEMALVCKSGCLCSLTGRELRISEVFFGAFNSLSENVLVWAESSALLE